MKNISQEKKAGIRTLVLDFDGTLICGSILPNWVFVILGHPGLCFRQKLFFFCNSMVRGFLSLLFSRFARTSERGVKLACMNFKGIETDTVEKLICQPAPGLLRIISRFLHGKNPDQTAVRLNQKLLPVLQHVIQQCETMPEIRIYSQGSFPLAIRMFLQRKDVEIALCSAGIRADAVLLDVNEPEMEKDRIFTGRVREPIRTKYSRIYGLDESCLFIGDDADERVIRRAGLENVRFVNWKKVCVHGNSLQGNSQK
ncbi:MAG: hypothetical protein AB7S75_13440 [Desulfococcaceae bacterium]